MSDDLFYEDELLSADFLSHFFIVQAAVAFRPEFFNLLSRVTERDERRQRQRHFYPRGLERGALCNHVLFLSRPNQT